MDDHTTSNDSTLTHPALVGRVQFRKFSSYLKFADFAKLRLRLNSADEDNVLISMATLALLSDLGDDKAEQILSDHLNYTGERFDGRYAVCTVYRLL